MLKYIIDKESRESHKEFMKDFHKKRNKIIEKKKQVVDEIKDFNKEVSPFFIMKDKFVKIYPISLGLIGFLTIPIILFMIFISFPKSAAYSIVYLFFTFPFFIVSASLPIYKFFFHDLKNKVGIAKVYFGNDYIIALMFSRNRRLKFLLKKVDNDAHFIHEKGTYTVDRTETFFSVARVVISFYIEGIPNPVKFNFKKTIQEFVDKKNKNINDTITDWDKETVDIGFSSVALSDYKNKKFADAFLQNHFQAHDTKYLIVIGVMAVIMLIMFMTK